MAELVNFTAQLERALVGLMLATGGNETISAALRKRAGKALAQPTTRDAWLAAWKVLDQLTDARRSR